MAGVGTGPRDEPTDTIFLNGHSITLLSEYNLKSHWKNLILWWQHFIGISELSKTQRTGFCEVLSHKLDICVRNPLSQNSAAI